MIPEEKVAEIRERTDLVALVKDYVALKKSGSSWKGLCPFHGEKTPSFYVHPDRGFYHCFGCQESGDAIKFFMKIDGHTFVEALRILAERAGVEITVADEASDRAARQARARKERLLAAMDAAAGFFAKMLTEHRFGGMAQAELDRRCISGETARRFRLGYAPHGWDELATFLVERGFPANDAVEVGLVSPRRSGDGHYDRFRHRLMFPVSDPHGRIVAFSGRILDPVPGDDRLQEAPAKYVNSPETPVYKKGEILFGLHEARVDLRRQDVALLCEGNFDVLALSQAGFANVVAPLGTAFTLSQAKLLRRYASSVVLVFDSDAAGAKAVRAAQPLLSQAGLSGRVVTLPPGDDPDSFLRNKGREAMEKLIDGAPGMIEYLIEASAAEAGADAHAKAEAIEALGPALKVVENEIERRLYVERIAQAFEMRDVAAVARQLHRGARDVKREAPIARAVPKAEELPEIEADLVGAFLDQPALHAESDCAEKVQGLLTSADLRAIFSLTRRWVGSRGIDAAALLGELESDNTAREWLERRLAVQKFEDEASARSYVDRATAKLARERAKRDGKLLNRQILEAQRAGDMERAEALRRQSMDLFRSAARGGTTGTKR